MLSSDEDNQGFQFLYETAGLMIAYKVVFSDEYPIIRQAITVSCIGKEPVLTISNLSPYTVYAEVSVGSPVAEIDFLINNFEEKI